MVDSTGETAQGVTLRIAPIPVSPALPSYIEVANVTSITLAGREREQIDFTHLRSTSGVREMRGGFAAAGTLSMNLQFNPSEASHEALQTYFNGSKSFLWQIDLSTIVNTDDSLAESFDVTIDGKGFITNPGDLNFEISAAIMQAVTFQNSGPVTINDIP